MRFNKTTKAQGPAGIAVTSAITLIHPAAAVRVQL